MLPALLLNVVVDLWRLQFARLAFHLPAVYSVGIHSVLTHYIPRYNLPLFGVFAIELCLAAAFLWSLRRRHSRPSPEQALGQASVE
jgi:hypothetical protein